MPPASATMSLGPDAPEIAADRFLGGRVEAVQPAAGAHRAGLEGVLLGASMAADIKGTVVDLGAGAGVAGFCVAARAAMAEVVLVERDPIAAGCARLALSRPANGAFAGRVRIVEADIATAEIGRDFAEAVVMNPPFHERSSTSPSPDAARADAHVLAAGGLTTWFRAAASIVRPGGRVITIFRADGLDGLLAAIGGRLGAVAVLPIHARAGLAAHRILVRGIKGNRGRLRLLPPLVLHGPSGHGFLPAVEAMLRDGAGLAEALPAWKEA